MKDNQAKIPTPHRTNVRIQRLPGRPKKPHMISHSIRMSKDLLRELKVFANKNYGEGAGLSPIICNMIKEYLNNKNTI